MAAGAVSPRRQHPVLPAQLTPQGQPLSGNRLTVGAVQQPGTLPVPALLLLVWKELQVCLNPY